MASLERLGLQAEIDRTVHASVTVRFAGEFDGASVAVARRAVEQVGAQTEQIVLDLSEVTFFSAAGVWFVLVARAEALAAGRKLVLYPSIAVRRVLELTGALPVICPGEPDGAARPAAFDPHATSICDEVVASAIRVSGASMGNVQIVDPASGALRIVAQHGFGRPFLEFFETVDDKQSACGAALAAGQPMWVADVARSPIFAGTRALDVMLEAGCQAVASVPVLASGGNVIAMISTHRRQPKIWSDDQKGQLQALASSAGQLLSG